MSLDCKLLEHRAACSASAPRYSCGRRTSGEFCNPCLALEPPLPSLHETQRKDHVLQSLQEGLNIHDLFANFGLWKLLVLSFMMLIRIATLTCGHQH